MSLKRITLSVQSEHLAMLAALTWNSLSYDSSEYQLTTTSTRHNTEVRVSKWPKMALVKLGLLMLAERSQSLVTGCSNPQRWPSL
jgi:hypothetical protein